MDNSSQTNYTAVIISLIIGAVIGFFIGTTFGVTDDDAIQTAKDQEKEIMDRNSGLSNSNTDSVGLPSGEVDSTLVEGRENERAFTIKINALPAEQQTMLNAAGVTGETIDITNGMVACAEKEMGANRVIEIKDGAEISLVEGSTFVKCYTNN